ncbi:MAG: T9SS type A sorting domain-containing protein [Bacteroidales bacterium]|jgi:hypothetical protein|nr:T9SS type A sorting domain-containing protein [Bacteroidales bacterium]
MKRLILLLAVVVPIVVSGQQKLEVISSAGGYSVATGISISWTLGETIIPNYEIPGVISLAHGFQQKLIITKIDETIDNPVRVTVYPNPVSDIVRIEFDQPIDKEIRLSLVDFRGKMIEAEVLGAGTLLYELNMQNLSSGLYYIRLQKGSLINIYRVIKL